MNDRHPRLKNMLPPIFMGSYFDPRPMKKNRFFHGGTLDVSICVTEKRVRGHNHPFTSVRIGTCPDCEDDFIYDFADGEELDYCPMCGRYLNFKIEYILNEQLPM